MAIASTASVQAQLDTTAQGRGVRITRDVRVSSVLTSYYITPVITSRGQAGWLNRNCTSSASAQAAGILTSIPGSGAATRFPST